VPIEGVTFAVRVFFAGLAVIVIVKLTLVLVSLGPVFVTSNVLVFVSSGEIEIERRERVTIAVRVVVCVPNEGDLIIENSSVIVVLVDSLRETCCVRDGVFSEAVMVVSEEGVGGESDADCDGVVEKVFDGETSTLNCIVEDSIEIVWDVENDFDMVNSLVPRLGDCVRVGGRIGVIDFEFVRSEVGGSADIVGVAEVLFEKWSE
jgi:hypothetical protein